MLLWYLSYVVNTVKEREKVYSLTKTKSFLTSFPKLGTFIDIILLLWNLIAVCKTSTINLPHRNWEMCLADPFVVRPTFCHALLILCRPIKFLYSRFSDIPFKPPITSAYVAFFGQELENQQVGCYLWS